VQHTSTRCNTLQLPQHSATLCNTLLHTATNRSTPVQAHPVVSFLPKLQPHDLLQLPRIRACVSYTAANCNSLQHSATHPHTATRKQLSRVRAYINCQVLCKNCNNTLQHTATHCNTLQHTHTQTQLSRVRAFVNFTASYCNTLLHSAVYIHSHCNILQHTATHCTTQQHPAMHLHHDNTHKHCNTLQHIAAYCNALMTLQHT